MNLQNLFRSVLLITVTGIGTSVFADTSQSVIEWQGQVDAVNTTRHEITVGDKAFYLDAGVPVKTAGGLPTTVKRIRKGSQVKVLLLDGNIQEIRILK